MYVIYIIITICDKVNYQNGIWYHLKQLYFNQVIYNTYKVKKIKLSGKYTIHFLKRSFLSLLFTRKWRKFLSSVRNQRTWNMTLPWSLVTSWTDGTNVKDGVASELSLCPLCLDSAWPLQSLSWVECWLCLVSITIMMIVSRPNWEIAIIISCVLFFPYYR